MNPIEPRAVSEVAFAVWQKEAGCYLPSLVESRAQAASFLTHWDPIARCAAIESFIYLWHCDSVIVQNLFEIAIQDVSNVVRYTAASTLMLLHLRCRNTADQVLLQLTMKTIIAATSQIPEIVSDVNRYLEIMAVEEVF